MTEPFRRRVVFIDVDGTLMQDGRYIPPSAIAAIRTARANGHLVFLSTGRGMAELRGPVLDIGFDGAVTNGGAYGSVGEQIIVSRLMSDADIARLEERFRAHGVHWYFQSYEGLYASPELPGLMAAYLERDRIRHREAAIAAGVEPDESTFFSVGMKVFDDPSRFVAAETAKAVILSDDAEAIAAALAELGRHYAVVSGTIPCRPAAPARSHRRE